MAGFLDIIRGKQIKKRQEDTSKKKDVIMPNTSEVDARDVAKKAALEKLKAEKEKRGY